MFRTSPSGGICFLRTFQKNGGFFFQNARARELATILGDVLRKGRCWGDPGKDTPRGDPGVIPGGDF